MLGRCYLDGRTAHAAAQPQSSRQMRRSYRRDGYYFRVVNPVLVEKRKRFIGDHKLMICGKRKIFIRSSGNLEPEEFRQAIGRRIRNELGGR